MNNDRTDALNGTAINDRTDAVNGVTAINERTNTEYTDAVYLCKRCELALRSANRHMKRVDNGHESAVRRCAVCERYAYCGTYVILADHFDRRQNRPNGF